MKILKMIGELLTMTIIYSSYWCHLQVVYYSKFLHVILHHTCQFGCAIGWTFLEANLGCFEEEKKGFAAFLMSLNFGNIKLYFTP